MLSHLQFTKAITAIAGCDKAARLAVVDKYDNVRRASGVNAAHQWLETEAKKRNRKLHHVLAVVQDDAARRIIQAALDNKDFEKQEYLEARLSDDMIADAASYLGLDEDKIRAQAPTPLERRRLRFKVKQSISAINRAVGATGGNGYALATPFEMAMRQKQKDNQDDWALKTHIYNRETNTILNMAEIMDGAGKKKVAEILAIAKGLQDFGDKHNLVPIFYTLTAPPRMHANPTVGRNSYDGTTPREAQRWIHGKHRTAFQILRDEGIFPAGVRTVEGHKDECPHWHCCAWMPSGDVERFEEVLRSVAESWKSERGCDIKNMSLEVEGKNKAKAISYLFKYILKSIGGLGEDEGIDSELSQSISQQDCWRAKHGIRGFQFFGLPSLNLWRNLRKSPEHIDDELLNAARTAAKNGEGCNFIEAAGGLNLKRKERPISTRIEIFENQENEESNGKFVTYSNRLNGFEITQKLKTWEVINEEEKENLLTVIQNHPRKTEPYSEEAYYGEDEIIFGEELEQKPSHRPPPESQGTENSKANVKPVIKKGATR